MTVFALIGFGELGSCLAEGLGRSPANLVRVYTPERSQPAAAAALEGRLRRSGAQRSASLQEAVAGATVVLSVVPASVSREVAEHCASLLDRGAYYVDLAAAPVEDKEIAAGIVVQVGALYVDGAVLGTAATSGFEVPIIASGPVSDARRGIAHMKGRDALVVEMMLAARRYGLEDRVAESIKGPGEIVPFPALAERVLCALAVHAERRADELLASSEIVRAAGVDPVISRAGSEVLRRLGQLELRDAFDRQRPSSAAEVLAAIDELSGRLGSADA